MYGPVEILYQCKSLEAVYGQKIKLQTISLIRDSAIGQIQTQI